MTIDVSHRAATTVRLSYSVLLNYLYNSSTIFSVRAAQRLRTHSLIPEHCPHQLGPLVGTIFVYKPALPFVEEGSCSILSAFSRLLRDPPLALALIALRLRQ